MPSAEELKAELGKLPARDRADLAHFLLTSLDNGKDDDCEAAWDAELARRLEQIDSGTVSGTSSEEVFATLRAKPS